MKNTLSKLMWVVMALGVSTVAVGESKGVCIIKFRTIRHISSDYLSTPAVISITQKVADFNECKNMVGAEIDRHRSFEVDPEPNFSKRFVTKTNLIKGVFLSDNTSNAVVTRVVCGIDNPAAFDLNGSYHYFGGYCFPSNDVHYPWTLFYE